MTLNDLERCNSHYFELFSRNSTDCQADYIIAAMLYISRKPVVVSVDSDWAACGHKLGHPL